MHDIKKIIDEIIKYLEENISTTEEKFVVNSIKKCVFDEKTLNNIKPNSPPKHKSLLKGLLSISSNKIIPLKNSMDNHQEINSKIIMKIELTSTFRKKSILFRIFVNILNILLLS